MRVRLAASILVTGLSIFLSGSPASWPASWPAIRPAAAQRNPGVQDQPPMSAAPLDLAQASDGRRAVRGCPVGQDCAPPHQQLRRIELELFPAADGPWRSSDSLSASAWPRAEKIARRPSELRPDLAWLDDAELPDLPVRWTPRLVEYLQFYKDDPRGRNIMRGWLTAQGRYRDLILARLQAAGLPLDLMYVAMIESSFDPGEASHAGAAGLWQFMPAGGRIYGLAQTHWVDERRDPLRATVAVVDYWKDLYQRFGDWHLAMAAFNAGYGAVLRSIARYNTNDYWQLCQYENALAWETSLYVPKALAVAIVGHNLELFGFSNLKSDAPEAWEEVAVPGALAVGVIARAAGTTADRIKRLNPHLRRSRTPPDAKSYVVRVPRGAKPGFAKRLADLQTEWDGFDAYVVAYGERFEDVAATFGLSKRRLRELNELSDDSEVGGGSVLVVPRVSAEQRAKNRAAARVALHESGVDQQPGEPLIVALPDRDARLPDTRRVFYRVVIGDTLTAVARAFSVPAAELARWNGLTVEAGLHPRMVLVLHVPSSFDAERRNVALLDEDKLTIVTRGSPEHLDLIEERVGRTRVRYVAERAEPFEAIAKKFGLKAADLARVNHLSPRTVLAPGQAIIVYQVVDRGRSERAAEQWKKVPRARRGKAAGDKARGVTGRVGRSAEEVEVADDDVTGEHDERRDGAQEPANRPTDKTTDKATDKPADKPADKADRKSAPAPKGAKDSSGAKAAKDSSGAKAAKGAKDAKARDASADAEAGDQGGSTDGSTAGGEAAPVTSPTQLR
ncbi:MAG: LysM peptidoglycan-binding domain-containing protein [Myxococcales bacterium]|nr:LysM peptidoglycan-binding domain-containing protein [Myxococcales bacterium]